MNTVTIRIFTRCKEKYLCVRISVVTRTEIKDLDRFVIIAKALQRMCDCK